jgi:HK97 family phage prohead protease
LSIFYENNKIDFIKNNHIYFNNAINYNIMQLEKKNLVFEIKQENISEQGIVFGYASTDDIDLDNDIIEAGAFQKSIDNWMINKKSIKALYQHKNSDVIGNIIELKYEGDKLKIAMQLYIKGYNGNQIGVSLSETAFILAKEGELSFSVGFYNAKFRKETKENKDYRVIEEATLYEVSLVRFPANQNAVVVGTKSTNIKSLIENLQEPDICDTIKNLKSIYEFDCFCEDTLQMPRKTRKAFKHFINEHIKSEVEKQTIQQPAPEFQKVSDTNEPAPSDTNEVADVKSNEIIEKIFKTLNIN